VGRRDPARSRAPSGPQQTAAGADAGIDGFRRVEESTRIMNTIDLQARLDTHARQELDIDVVALTLPQWRKAADSHPSLGPLELASGFALVEGPQPEEFTMLYCPEVVVRFVAHEDPRVVDDLLTLVELIIDLNLAYSDVIDLDERRYLVESSLDTTNPDLLGHVSLPRPLTKAADRAHFVVRLRHPPRVHRLRR
jgi:hypothetical protein